MTRNALFLLIGALGVCIAVLGYLYYQETRAHSSIEIQIDGNGLSMEEK